MTSDQPVSKTLIPNSLFKLKKHNPKMRNTLVLFFLSFKMLVFAQNFSGRWQGVLTQPNKTDTFFYEMHLQQAGTSLSGTSYSRSADGKTAGKFTLTGAWDGKQLVIQEINQIEPKNGGWCLKYILLQYTKKENTAQLFGDWKADGCSPGKLLLQRPISSSEPIETQIPFTWAGYWTGQLSQSDRDYGFFYECNFQVNGIGQSYIVSEDNGGSAHHDLNWVFNERDSVLIIKELEVSSKTDVTWKWCIKSARLKLRRNANGYTLEGDWQGYLEGFTPQTGKCASGTLFLEKPITTQQIRQQEVQASKIYEAEAQREVRVSRVVEVQKPVLQLKVWDSGTVDGDIVTLFLNGKKILDKHRVNKSKYAISVKLEENNNFLILHAEDLGSIPPNTIAVSVDDGVKEQMLVLSSDLKMSGAVLVKQFSVNKE